MALSSRGQVAAQPDDAFMLWTILKDLWHPDTNPDGYVSLGVAENLLMFEDLKEHIQRNLVLTSHAFGYGDGATGSKRLKNAIANFLTKHLHPIDPIDTSHVVITNGCSSALEHLSWAFGNPGDGFLLGQPYYGAFVADFSIRTGGHIVPVQCSGSDPFGIDVVEKYEAAYEKAIAAGQRVAGLIVCNPHNPLGRCYPRTVLIKLMRLCQKHQMHLISDEIYALSIWENKIDTSPAPVPFTSALSIDLKGIIDPALVHVVWGMSKDFGANGIRIGAVISQHNPTLHQALVPVTLYSTSSSISELATANVLEDEAWVEKYLNTYRLKLAKHYQIVTDWARSKDVVYAPGGNAGFFLWVNLGATYLKRNPKPTGKTLNDSVLQALLDAKIFLASGKVFGSEEDGWFRIVFSHPEDYLQEGLKRITLALDL